jgi:4-amino-4-deoxy-L-arabinose transferase-like glycosyltransferase
MFSRLRLFITHPGTGFRAPARIFWVGLTVRVLYIAIAHTYRIRLLLDHFQFGWEAGRIARAVATGYGYSDPFMGHSGPTTWIPPLFPLLLAGVFKLFGVYTPVSAFVILTIDSVFSAATALAIYEIAARCYDANGHGRRIALWSAWLWALYPAAMQYGVHWIWDMALTTFLFTLTLVVALRVRAIGDPPSNRNPQTTARWAAFGLLWGLIALTNPSLMIVLPACGLWMLWGTRASLSNLLAASAKAAVAALVLAACLAPWVYRNFQVFHAFIPTRGNLGAELYQSTLPENDGFPWGPTLPLAETAPEFLHYKAIGELAYVREKNIAAHEAIHQHPDRIVKWTIRRVYFFWASVPHPFEKTVVVEYTREINFGFLSVTGILGLILSIKRKVPAAWLFVAIFLIQPLIYYAVTVQARFRHPLEPLITIVTVFLFQSAERRRNKTAELHPISS